MYRGSRKHVLDWTGSPSFLKEFQQLLDLHPVCLSNKPVFKPKGVTDPSEARLEGFGPTWLPENPAWLKLRDWWLYHKAGANTPNWDIAIGCEIEDRPGLILVEAKANWPELNKAGKFLRADASIKSRENHEHIGAAIAESCIGWQQLDRSITINRDSHYQLANRLAFTWKLASFGIPVVLLYLGFTEDVGIRNIGAPFADEADWQLAFNTYVSGIVPLELFEKRLEIETTPVWLVSRSRKIIEVST